jgi:hypothetical protein
MSVPHELLRSMHEECLTGRGGLVVIEIEHEARSTWFSAIMRPRCYEDRLKVSEAGAPFYQITVGKGNMHRKPYRVERMLRDPFDRENSFVSANRGRTGYSTLNQALDYIEADARNVP